MRNKAIIYARLSREDEDRQDGQVGSKSIENQIKLLTDYASKNGLEIVKILYDDGYTGGNMERPSFKKLLKEIKDKTFGVLLVKDFSRIGRVMYAVGDFVENILPASGVRLISVDDKYDSLQKQEQSDFSAVFKYFINEYNLKDFKRKCKTVRIHNATTKHLSYYPKFGYKFDEAGNEIVDEYASSIVVRAFKLIDEFEFTTKKVAEIFNQENIPTRSHYAVEVLGLKPLNKNPSKLWTAEKVWEIVQDYEYCGHSINWVRKKKEEQILLKNTHKAIIDEDLFWRVQEIIKKRSKLKTRLNHIGTLLYDRRTNKHLLYARNQLSELSSVYFLRVDGCQQYSVRAWELEDVLYQDVLATIEACRLNRDEIYKIYKRKLFGVEEYDIENFKMELEKTNLVYSKLLEQFFEGKITEVLFKSTAKKLKEKIEEIEKRIAQASAVESELQLFDKRFGKFLKSLKTVPMDKLSLIRALISKVYINANVDGKKLDLTIVYKIEEF